MALTNENISLEKQLISYQKSIGNNRSMSKDNGSETGSLRGHHIGQRSASEVHLSENNAASQQHHGQQQQHGSVQNHLLNATQSVHGHHSAERRSAGSGGSGSMLGLPTQPNSNPLSPAHSPLATTRNYHQSFHQLPRPGMHRSEYHHQLPAIPIQGGHHSLLQSSSSSGHGSPQLKVRAHYGSLPIPNSTLDYDDEEYGAVENVLPRPTRTLHRSRERVAQFAPAAMQANMQAPNAAFGTGGPNNMANNFGQSLSTLPYTAQYGVVPTSPLPLSANPMQQSHLSTNGWSSNGATGKLVPSGGVTFFDPM